MNAEHDANLIDLKSDRDENIASVVAICDEDEQKGMFNYEQLKLIEKPSLKVLPHTLEDCVGFLIEFPLIQPNVDNCSIPDMVNILSIPEAKQLLEVAMDLPSYGAEETWVNEWPGEYKLRQIQTYSNGETEPLVSLKIQANNNNFHVSAPLTFGHVVRPGCMSFYSKYGLVYAVPEGKWWLPSPTAKWMKGFKNLSLDQDLIKSPDNQVIVIRVIEGQVGLITVQGVHNLLDVGTHVFNSGTVQCCGVVCYSDKSYFGHGPYHYMNIPRGKYAKVWVEVVDREGKSVVPRLIKEGEHFIKSSFFKFDGLVDVSKDCIQHDCIHVLNVVRSQVAKIYQDNIPRLLSEGVHIIESSKFKYEENVLIEPDNLCITHGTITILQVPRGKIALAWNKNEPYFLDEPGLYEFNSNNFHFVSFADAEERKIELGSKKIIQVYTGEVGITYDDGELRVLDNGRHIIDSSTHVFERFLSTKQRSVRLITYGAEHKISKKSKQILDDDSDYLICETRDIVKVGIRADVFYSITNPTKCIRTLDTDELEDLVRETAVATLTNIIRSTALNEIAQSRNVTASSQPETEVINATIIDPVVDAEEQDTAPAAVGYFFEHAHDMFMSKLHEDFVSRYGVDIANIRMESFKIMDVELSKEISQNCLLTAHVENELANLEGQNSIVTQKERTEADCQNIKAVAEAAAQKVSADAENKRKTDAARAESEALKCRAMAEAQAAADTILLRAKAEAEAIRLKAEAEAERATLLSQTQLGQQQSMLEIYSDMVKTSNKGVQKVVYIDPSVNRDSPFALGSLDTLNRDLHSLTKVGIATDGINKE